MCIFHLHRFDLIFFSDGTSLWPVTITFIDIILLLSFHAFCQILTTWFEKKSSHEIFFCGRNESENRNGYKVRPFFCSSIAVDFKRIFLSDMFRLSSNTVLWWLSNHFHLPFVITLRNGSIQFKVYIDDILELSYFDKFNTISHEQFIFDNNKLLITLSVIP